MSISDFHPESWNPIWPVNSIVIGLISFFVTTQNTVGAVYGTNDERKMKCAQKSAGLVRAHPKYDLFKEDFEKYIGLEEKKELE